MAFTEAVKLSAKRRAHFMCCLCHSLGVEVHHVIPQGEGGHDTEENAAPLCPYCHETYGANPLKRKFIREARDLWYDICDRRYVSDPDRLDQINALLRQTATRDDLAQATSRLAELLKSTVTPMRTREESTAPIVDQWSEATLHDYLRWLYPSVSHCGSRDLSRLFGDLGEIGYGSIAELHAVIGDTREGFAVFAQEWRDEGGDVDASTDGYPTRLFLAIFDEEYCRIHYPKIYSDRRPELWRRRSKQTQ